MQIDQVPVRKVSEVNVLQVKELVPDNWDLLDVFQQVLGRERPNV